MTSDCVYNCKIEHLDSIGKTFVWLIVSYLNGPVYQLDSHLFAILSKYFFIQEDIIRDFSLADENCMNYNAIRFLDGDYGTIEYYDSNLFETLVCISNAMDILDKITFPIKDYASWEDLVAVNEYLWSANRRLSYHEFKNSGITCGDYSPFNNANYDVAGLLDSMRFLSFIYEKESHNKLLELIVKILKFELYSRCKVLCIITVCQILKTSPFWQGEIAEIASDFHDLLFFFLQNARLYSFQTNILAITGSDSEKRDASNNTTRLRMCYGYSNYDTYVLRLDFAHKGKNFVHINNESPARISCCIFSKDDYQRIISEYPSAVNLFVKYENRYALKERINCNLNGANKNIYEIIAKRGAHFKIFKNNYSETAIGIYLTCLSSILSGIGRKIKKGDEYPSVCFHYNRIMMLARLLYLAYISMNKESIDKAIGAINKTGIKYSIIKQEDTFPDKASAASFIIDYVTESLYNT